MATQSTLPPSSPAYGSTSARKSLSPDTESTPPTFQHRRKGVVNTCTVVGTRFDERHVVLLGVGDCLLRGDTALVREIALVSDLYFSDASETYENHDHITFRVLTKLGEPALHILERGSGSDVIHHERTDRSSVISSASYRESKPVRAGDGTVSLLSRYTVTRRERLRTCVPPTVALESRLNSSFVNRDKMLVFPTLESPIRTTSTITPACYLYSCTSNHNGLPWIKRIGLTVFGDTIL